MIFTQIEYFIFLAIILVLTSLVKPQGIRKQILLIGSMYFYGYWDYRFLALILGCVAVNYVASRIIVSGKTSVAMRRTALTIAVAASLGSLGFFKYFNFFVDSVSSVWGLDHPFLALKIILPVGISFFTFQAISFTVDNFKQQPKTIPSFTDFALYVSFFPQLVAGPIVRAAEFLPQLQEDRKPTWGRLQEGAHIFVVGLFKKVFIADNLAFYVDPVFENYTAFDTFTIWMALLAYSIQIYADFSGYSGMAIGTAKMLGYDFSSNFNYPYVAKSVSEFWHRWHISLSTWLRDYLYIPLGGSRVSPSRTRVNLFITMVLGGLWHGANWTFVCWGILHGGALCICHLFKEMRGEKPGLPTPVGYLLTMMVVLVGWALFRSASMTDVVMMFERMFMLSEGVQWLNPFAISVIVIFYVWNISYTFQWVNAIDLTLPTFQNATIIFLMIWLVIIFQPTDSMPFIYFQF